MFFRRLLIIPLLLLIGLLCLKPIQLATADLGRHLINGRLLIEEGLSSSVLRTNMYSYTQTDFSVLNHHWLFGVFSYVIYSIGGFSTLSWLGAGLVVTAVAISYSSLRQRSNVGQSLLSLFLLIPLLTYRTEIRPELVSMVFLSLELWILIRHQKNKLSWFWLYVTLCVIQLLWVNIHIFFVFGLGTPMVFGIFSDRKHWLKWGGLCLALTATSLLNPHGFAGILAPLTIFQTYEYQIVENQSIWFMVKRFGQPTYVYPLILFGGVFTCIALTVGTWVKKRNWQQYKELFPLIMLSILFIAVNMRVVRLLPFSGLVIAPLLATALQTKKWWQWITRQKDQSAVLSLGLPVGFVLITLLLATGLFWPNWSQIGYGLSPENTPAITFLQTQIKGPIFNNYDIGGMLIYALYPRLSVYTDNRPEAYPVGFFPNDYVKPQEDKERWLALLAQYDFQTIIFYRHDATPWGQPFLIERIAEDDWQPVFVDESMIVLVRNSALNQATITTYGLPKSMFSGNPQE